MKNIIITLLFTIFSHQSLSLTISFGEFDDFSKNNQDLTRFSVYGENFTSPQSGQPFNFGSLILGFDSTTDLAFRAPIDSLGITNVTSGQWGPDPSRNFVSTFTFLDVNQLVGKTFLGQLVFEGATPSTTLEAYYFGGSINFGNVFFKQNQITYSQVNEPNTLLFIILLAAVLYITKYTTILPRKNA